MKMKMARVEREASKMRMPLERVRWLQKLRRIAYVNRADLFLD
ncbi:MAG: hypothetical protein AABX40_05250 [Candidatus Hydrothermarchaeota archaeon]